MNMHVLIPQNIANGTRYAENIKAVIKMDTHSVLKPQHYAL